MSGLELIPPQVSGKERQAYENAKGVRIAPEVSNIVLDNNKIKNLKKNKI